MRKLLSKIFPCLFRLHYVKPLTNITNVGDDYWKTDRAIDLLRKFINTREFKKFCKPFPYIYGDFRRDWVINIKVVKLKNGNRWMTYKRDNNIIKYRPIIGDPKSDNRIAATLLHEYTHQLGYDHATDAPGTLGYHTQFEFEKWLNKYNNDGK